MLRMTCTRCGLALSRKHWRPSQWTHQTQIVAPYHCCKPCWSLGPNQRELDEYTARMELIRYDVEDWGSGQADFLMEFNAYAEAAGCRKRLSHRGALPTFLPTDPVHWTDPRTGQGYFDPGNAVYKQAVQYACPQFLEETGMSNEETIGDVIEALLGCYLAIQDTHDATRRWNCGISLSWAARFWRIVAHHFHRCSWISCIGEDW